MFASVSQIFIYWFDFILFFHLSIFQSFVFWLVILFYSVHALNWIECSCCVRWLNWSKMRIFKVGFDRKRCKWANRNLRWEVECNEWNFDFKALIWDNEDDWMKIYEILKKYIHSSILQSRKSVRFDETANNARIGMLDIFSNLKRKQNQIFDD